MTTPVEPWFLALVQKYVPEEKQNACIVEYQRVRTKRPLTPRQWEVLEYLRNTIGTQGFAPSFEEIAQRFGFRSLSTVAEHLSNLEAKNWIRRSLNEKRAITLMEE